MKSYADRRKINNEVSVVRSAQSSSGTVQTVRFIDNRPDSIAQRKLRKLANHSSRKLSITQSSSPGHNTSIKSTGGIVQGYFDIDSNLSAKTGAPKGSSISENGNLVKIDQRNLYAHPSLIQQGTKVLSKDSRFVLEGGQSRQFDAGIITGQYSPLDDNATVKTLRKVIPRQNKDIKDPREDHGLPSPIQGENSKGVSKKHRLYLNSLSQLVSDFDDLTVVILNMAIKKTPLMEKSQLPADYIWKWIKQNQLRNDIYGGSLMLALIDYEGSKDINELKASLNSLLNSTIDIINRDSLEEDSVVTVNDCKQHTNSVVSKLSLSDQNADYDPGLGANYHNRLQSPDSDNYGWNFHFAPIVLKDGSDNVTFETAAGLSFSDADKSTWWWNMYGTKLTSQSFRSKIKKAHAKRNLALTEQIPQKHKSKKTEKNADMYRFLSGMYQDYPETVGLSLSQEKQKFDTFLVNKNNIKKALHNEGGLLQNLLSARLDSSIYGEKINREILSTFYFMSASLDDDFSSIDEAKTYTDLDSAIKRIIKGRIINHDLLWQRLLNRSTTFSLYGRFKGTSYLKSVFSGKDVLALSGVHDSFGIFKSPLWAKDAKDYLIP